MSEEPVQEFFSIGEVCQLTDLKPHVLRYWESQFRFLNPAKNRSGNRVYQRPLRKFPPTRRLDPAAPANAPAC